MPETQNNTENSITSQVSFSPAEIWGKVITELRDRNLRLLFIACGEIDKVEIKDNCFIITAEQNNKVVIDIPENLKILQEIISNYLPNCDISVKEPMYEETEFDIQKKIYELFGNKLIIE